MASTAETLAARHCHLFGAHSSILAWWLCATKKLPSDGCAHESGRSHNSAVYTFIYTYVYTVWLCHAQLPGCRRPPPTFSPRWGSPGPYLAGLIGSVQCTESVGHEQPRIEQGVVPHSQLALPIGKTAPDRRDIVSRLCGVSLFDSSGSRRIRQHPHNGWWTTRRPPREGAQTADRLVGWACN